MAALVQPREGNAIPAVALRAVDQDAAVVGGEMSGGVHGWRVMGWAMRILLRASGDKLLELDVGEALQLQIDEPGICGTTYIGDFRMP